MNVVYLSSDVVLVAAFTRLANGHAPLDFKEHSCNEKCLLQSMNILFYAPEGLSDAIWAYDTCLVDFRNKI